MASSVPLGGGGGYFPLLPVLPVSMVVLPVLPVSMVVLPVLPQGREVSISGVSQYPAGHGKMGKWGK